MLKFLPLLRLKEEVISSNNTFRNDSFVNGGDGVIYQKSKIASNSHTTLTKYSE